MRAVNVWTSDDDGRSGGMYTGEEKRLLLASEAFSDYLGHSDSQQPAVLATFSWCATGGGCERDDEASGLAVEGLWGARFGLRCDGFSTGQGSARHWPGTL